MSTYDRYGSYNSATTCYKFSYVIFKLLSTEGFSTKEAKQDLEICDRTCRRMISGIKETYIGEDGQEYVANDSVRFWAGRDVSMMNIAPFRVLQDGTLIAS